MSREIKFRGLNAQGEMVYGDLRHDLPNSTAYYDEYPARICWYEDQASCNQPIKKGTEGQYTGLKDVNGVEIYEGDILTAHQFLFDGNEVESVILGVVGSNEFGWTLSRIKNKFYEDYTGFEPFEGESNLGDFYGLHEESFEVIGNIHQNAELLESES